MRVQETTLPGVLVIEPRRFSDPRGYFQETWSEEKYREAGVMGQFVQDNWSVSRKDVIRGLHYQWPHPQGKLVSVLRGEIWDVAVDVRQNSPTFGKWVGVTLSAESPRQLWIPEGFAHGFLVLSEEAAISYKCTDYYRPDCEHTLLWEDRELAIDWPVERPILSEKDRNGDLLRSLNAYR